MTSVQSTDTHEIHREAVTGRILETIAMREGTSPLEFEERLYDAIDPEAVEAIVASGRFEGTIEFQYLGYRVVVDGDGGVQVTKRED